LKIKLNPVAYVSNSRNGVEDDYWGGVESSITLDENMPVESLNGIESFSHLEIIYFFHKGNPQKVTRISRHPRNNKNWPKVGVFAQRGKSRPNQLGLSIVRLIKREGRTLLVTGLDAINGSPVMDIKPVIREFLPAGEILQPEWVSDLMASYWKVSND